MLGRSFETLLIAVMGGVLFSYIHIPLPWMLGPLSAVMLWNALAKRKVYWPVKLRNAGLIVLGFIMGSPFTLETGRQIVLQLPTMLAATLATVFISMGIGYFTARQTGISLSSSLVGSVPGGLSQMVVLGEELADTDITVVTFMQTVRLLSVVFIVPFLAIHGLAPGTDTSTFVTVNTAFADERDYGLFAAVSLVSAVAAAFFKLPTPYMLGPLLGTACTVLAGFAAPLPPDEVVLPAQLAVGIYMGTGMNLQSLTNWKSIFPYTLMGAIGVVLFSLVLGYLISSQHSYSLVTAFLSTAPGGMTEMGLTAMILHADLSVIIAYQIFRLVFILLAVPPLLKWLLQFIRQKNEFN
ncbi:putative membrane protein [Propionispora sp. 2/2-37]|uniref:AbrB family transcriptional regulator n=1 Tax=Propionispora sp. 2/2-37 TaxID=1677858 RepID=UPI0006BB73AC|nr:AbrB family transcriptional regulator [Propionispora sp. 2/2-37]CUH96324.1 putative membrane protein [Propionispora sp. 2/2-37]